MWINSKIIERYMKIDRKPLVAAEKGFIDEVIMPRNTRRRISRAFTSLRNKKLSTLRNMTIFHYREVQDLYIEDFHQE